MILKNSKLIFGGGYLGARVGALWRQAGAEVTLVTRSPERAQSWRKLGYGSRVADVTAPASLCDLPRVDTVLYAVGYDRESGHPMRKVYVEGFHNVLDALPAERVIAKPRVIYISSTGVYAQDDGGWVDETSPCAPRREGGKACLAAEHLLARHPLGAKSVVLRLAGLYGPGRIPLAQSLKQGEPLAKTAEGYLNLIHVDDAARIVLLAENWFPSGPGPHLLCVADGHPVPRDDYYRYLAQALNAPAPTFTPPHPDSPAAVRGATNKRIFTGLLAKELAPRLLYPDYRAGLRAILSEAKDEKPC